MKPSKISTVKRGDFIKRKPDSKKVYIRGEYCKIDKSYSCIDFHDICREIFIKSNTIVFIDFEF